MKDKRHVEFSKEAPRSIQLTGHDQRIGLEEYRDQKWPQEALTTSTSEPQEEDWDQDLALSPPTVEWGHFVTQLTQDPREDYVTNSGQGTAAMEEGDVDMVGVKEVEERDGEAAASVIPD